MLCVSEDHSPGAGTAHLVFLEINESLDWSAIHVILLCYFFDILNTFVRFALIFLLIIDTYFYEKK